MLPVKEDLRMTPGFWPEELEEWGCHLLVKGRLRERYIEVGEIKNYILDILEFGQLNSENPLDN